MLGHLIKMSFIFWHRISDRQAVKYQIGYMTSQILSPVKSAQSRPVYIGNWLHCNVGPVITVKLSDRRCLAFSPLCRFAPWLVRPLARSPSVRGWFAPWLVHSLALSSPLNTGNSTSRLYVIIVFRFRQFMHNDENKRLCKCLMLCSILKQNH